MVLVRDLTDFHQIFTVGLDRQVAHFLAALRQEGDVVLDLLTDVDGSPLIVDVDDVLGKLHVCGRVVNPDTNYIRYFRIADGSDLQIYGAGLDGLGRSIAVDRNGILVATHHRPLHGLVRGIVRLNRRDGLQV